MTGRRCFTCRRPDALCWCRDLVAVPTRTRVVILQHPREHAVKMNTARLAHLGLAHAELRVGVTFDDDPRLRALAAEADGHVLLLYPDAAPSTRPPPAVTPHTLVVVDGTWTTARKMVSRSRLLSRLPRLSLRPAVTSAYRIRREPAAHCLSTLEAVVAALVELEGHAERFAALRTAFARMVETQIGYGSARARPYRHDRRRRRARRPSRLEALLAGRRDDVVLAQAETGGPPHELVELVALRLGPGDRFVRFVRAGSALPPHIGERLGLTAASLAGGDDAARVARDWRAFVAPRDVLVGWGRFTPTVLAQAGFACPGWIDLRPEVARRLGYRPGGPEAACRALGTSPKPAWAPGRAGAVLAVLAAVVDGLGRLPIPIGATRG